MELTKLISNLEDCLFGNLNYGIMFLLKDEKSIAELVDMLRELLERRKADGSEDGNDALPEKYLGKATVRKKYIESFCKSYEDAIHHIQGLIFEYNKIVSENKDKGFPRLILDMNTEQNNIGSKTINLNLEVRMPITGGCSK